MSIYTIIYKTGNIVGNIGKADATIAKAELLWKFGKRYCIFCCIRGNIVTRDLNRTEIDQFWTEAFWKSRYRNRTGNLKYIFFKNRNRNRNLNFDVEFILVFFQFQNKIDILSIVVGIVSYSYFLVITYNCKIIDA